MEKYLYRRIVMTKNKELFCDYDGTLYIKEKYMKENNKAIEEYTKKRR